MGPVARVQAFTATLAHERIEVEDIATATLTFASGALGVIEASTGVYPGYLKRIEIHGTTGSAVLEEEDIKSWEFAKKARGDEAILDAMKNTKSKGGGASDPSAIGLHGHARQFQDFVKAIKNDTIPAIDGPEARKSVEIILAIYKSASSGKVVKLPT
jgi:predicted dehydrogenase